MYILTIIPIERGISKDSLSYFCKENVEIGSIVKVPIRKRSAFGLVIERKIAQEMKGELKSLAYSIKKIENIKTKSFLTPAFIKSAEKIAEYNACSVGAVLSVLIPKNILEESSHLFYTKQNPKNNTFYETNLLQTDSDERYATYRSLIREEFAKGHSVFFCLPTTEDLLNARAILEKGIEKYTYSIHSGLKKPEISSTWKKIIDEEHPTLIISTGSFLSIPKQNLGTIILEKESSRSYKMQTRPFVDIRTAVEILSKELKIRLVLGDILLRTETLWEEKKSGYSNLSPLKFRSLTEANCSLIDIKSPQDMKKKEFIIFSNKLKNILEETLTNNEHTFLFCGRKGLHPQTVCSDCGTVVSCKNCNTPLVLYSKKDNANQSKNIFVCHHCGERTDTKVLCKHCGGWRLNPLGLGVDRVVEEIKNLLPDMNVFVMDKEHITTHNRAVKERDSFYNTPGSVMVGTEMALTYLNQKVENMTVVSMDSYFSIPDFQINEKIFHILLEMRALATHHMIIQTRDAERKIFEYALRGNLIDFYRDEIADRKSFDYPPFATYVKLTLVGEKESVRKEMMRISETLLPYKLQVFDGWNPGSKQKYTVNGLVSVPKGSWPELELLNKLRALPMSVAVRIDPNTLL